MIFFKKVSRNQNIYKRCRSNAKECRKGGLIFNSVEDYNSIWNINDWLHFLYKINPEFDAHREYCSKKPLIINEGFREDEKIFYNTLREVNRLIDKIEPNCFKSLDETAFGEMFSNITLHYEADDFKHNNKRIERECKRASRKLCDKGIYPR